MYIKFQVQNYKYCFLLFIILNIVKTKRKLTKKLIMIPPKIVNKILIRLDFRGFCQCKTGIGWVFTFKVIENIRFVQVTNSREKATRLETSETILSPLSVCHMDLWNFSPFS